MQVSSNNYQNNTNFTGFKLIGNGTAKRLMTALEEECNADELLKIHRRIEKQVTNPVDIYIKDLGYHTGQPLNGHLEANIGNKQLDNGNPLNPLNWKLSSFFKRTANEAEKRNPRGMSKEAKKSFEHQIKADLYNQKDLRKRELVSEEEQKKYLLEEIYNLLIK